MGGEQVLTQQERVEQVRHLTKTDPDPRVRRRAHGALLVEQGQRLALLARFFGTAPHRVRAWQERFLTAGRAGLADQARGGRPPKLDEAARAFVSEALDRGPQAYGFPVTVWTLDELQTLLVREREVQVSRATLYRVVHTLGYRYRRPRPNSPRSDAPPACRSDGYGSPAAGVVAKKTGAEPGRLHLVDLDECEVHAHPHLAKVWRKKGAPMKVPAAGEDHQFVVFGARDDASGQLISSRSEQKGEEAFIAFLEQLAQALPAGDPAVLVLDNAGYHKRAALRAWWQAHADRFHPCWLPPYTPQLTLIERVWRYVKHKLACHRWWNDLDRLIQATEALLTGLEFHVHATDGPAFRSVQNFCESA
jgi:putative transposase